MQSSEDRNDIGLMGGEETGCLRTSTTMVVSATENRDGVVSMEQSQVETVPGPEPQRGPPSATGVSDPSELAREGRSRATGNITVMQWNAEGVRNKKLALQQFLKSHKIDICCLQETHLKDGHRFSVRGYEPFRLDRAGTTKGGVLTLVKNTVPAVEIYRSGEGGSELLGVKVLIGDKALTIFNLYSPSNKLLQLQEIHPTPEHWLIAGDFNSHSPSWGYPDLDKKGEDLEDWMLENQLVLLNRPDDPPSYYSRAWRTTSTPDVAAATDDIARASEREVALQLGGSDHKPVLIRLEEQARTNNQKQKPSWNYKKANWKSFEKKLDESCRKLDLQDKNLNEEVDLFTKAVMKAAKDSIPRVRRHNYKPGWSDQLQQLHEAVCVCREAMERNPTDESVTAHNKAQAEFTRAQLQQIRSSWQEKTQSLNMEKDTFKLWQLTKTLNEDRPGRKQTVLEVNGELQTGKKAANSLAEMYQQDSTVTLPTERTRTVREQLRQSLQSSTTNSCMSSALRMHELEDAIRSLKSKKAPGPDGVSNDMIKHFGNNAKHTLLKLFNKSWSSGAVPSTWKKAHVIPVHKKGKDKRDPKSYRPISLLSCLGKLMERILNRRLIWHLESNNTLTATQTGYRSHRNTEDQLMLLAQEIENAFQQKHKVVSVFFDLSKAFDRVWKEGLLLKAHQCGVTGKMFTWIKSFLHERSARVVLDGSHSVSVRMREGVPQGGVISPTLFLIYINDVTAVIPRHVSNTLHADDLAVWSGAAHTSSAAYRIQESVNKIRQWTEDWGLQLNKIKSVATVFSLSTTTKEEVRLKLDEATLPQTDTPTFLGIKLDSRLTWKAHLEETEARGIRRLALMRKLSGTTWGANSQILKTVYTGAVRPVLEYASSAWNSAAKTNKARLDKVQNLGLRTILGGMKSTPIREMEKVCNIQPLEDRRQEKLLIQGEKHKRLQSHPLHKSFQALTKNRLKRQSPNHLLKVQQRANDDILQPNPQLCDKLTNREWSPQSPGFHIRMSIPGISGKQHQSDTALRALALDEIHKRYPASKWTHVYTDGSAEDAIRNGGSGALIQIPGRPPETLSVPCGALASNFRAEVVALQTAADYLSLREDTPPKIVFLTDSLSALQSLNTSAELPGQLKHSLNALSRKSATVLQWIPAHCGIAGNEKADKLAKEGGQQQQPETSMTFQETRSLIKHRWKTAFKQRNGGYKPHQDSLHHLGRAEQTAIFRLRTGHCGLKAHLNRIGLANSAQCDCGEGEQTPQHVLECCPFLTQLRNQTWPEGTTFKTKLWGAAEDLRKTFQFTTSAGLRI